MDKTELYIKMSDCPEVQSHRKPKIEKMKDGRWHYEWDLEVGDFIATKDLYEKEKTRIEVKGTTIYDPYFYSTRKDANIDISIVGFDEGDGYVTKKFTWLPRQDQIQEMIFKEGWQSPWGVMIPELLHSANEVPEQYGKYYLNFASMEQLWLAFYMYEKHGKVWADGEKWVKKEE